MEDTNQNQYKVKSTVPFKLKDKPGRGGVMFDLYKTFKFFPEKVIIQKVAGEHDKFILSAVIEPKDAIAAAEEKGGASK